MASFHSSCSEKDTPTLSSSPLLLPLPPCLHSCLQSIVSKVRSLLDQFSISPSFQPDSLVSSSNGVCPEILHHANFLILVGGPGYGKSLVLNHLQHYLTQQHNSLVSFTSISAIEGCQFYSLESNASVDFLKRKYPFLSSTLNDQNKFNVMVMDDLMQLGSFDSFLDSKKSFLLDLYRTIRFIPSSFPTVFIISCHSLKDLYLPSDLFPRVFELPLLTRDTRREAFEIILETFPIENRTELCQSLAQRTHGYTLRNIVDLIRQTVLSAFHKASLSNTFLKESDFEGPLQWLQPSLGISKAFTRSIPPVHFNEVGGFSTLLHRLKQMCMLPMLHVNEISKLGVRPPSGILLYGPSGCGKTFIVRALASMTLLNVVYVKGPELFSKYLGESEQKIRDLFQEAQKNSPCLLFFDEMEAIGVKRAWNSDQSGSVDDRVLSTILNEMDGIASREGVMIIGCAHRPFDMDDALLRPGRLDHLVYVPMPSYEDRLSILQITFPPSEALSKLAQEMVGCTPADLAFLVREADVNGECTLASFESVWHIYRKHFTQARREALEAPYLKFQQTRRL